MSGQSYELNNKLECGVKKDTHFFGITIDMYVCQAAVLLLFSHVR